MGEISRWTKCPHRKSIWIQGRKVLFHDLGKVLFKSSICVIGKKWISGLYLSGFNKSNWWSTTQASFMKIEIRGRTEEYYLTVDVRLFEGQTNENSYKEWGVRVDPDYKWSTIAISIGLVASLVCVVIMQKWWESGGKTRLPKAARRYW